MPTSTYRLNETTGTSLLSSISTVNENRADVVEPQETRFEVITEIGELEKIEHDWNALFEHSGESKNTFQTFAWNWHWANVYLDPKHCRSTKLQVVLGYNAGRLVVVAPMITKTNFGLTRLAWMGDPVSQYGDILVETSQDDPTLKYRWITQTWDYIRKTIRPDAIVLRKVRGDANIKNYLTSIDASVTQCLEAPFLNIAEAKNYQEFEQRYAAKNRKNRRRHRRRLSEQGKVVSKLFHEGADAARYVVAGINLKRGWLANRGLVARAYADTRMDRFFFAIASDKTRPAGCNVSVLYVDDAVAAVDVAILCKGRYAAHIASYNLDYERNSPGSIALEEILDRCIKQGHDTYDFMAPNDTYKMAWANETMSVCDYAIPNSLKGQIYFYGYLKGVRPLARWALTTSPKLVRKILAPFSKNYIAH